MTQLHLDISNAEAIKILSAHVQDMIVRIEDMAYLKPQRRFVVVGNRFCWEAGDADYRTLCGFHFDHVEKVSYRGIQRDIAGGAAPDFIHLLAICFNATAPPQGVARLIFSGGGEIQLEVEAIEAHLRDMGERWAARQRPAHLEEA